MTKRSKLRPTKKAPTLRELAKQQGVGPVHDLNEIIDLWPKDDDPDELLRFILEERKGRRQLHRRGRKEAS